MYQQSRRGIWLWLESTRWNGQRPELQRVDRINLVYHKVDCATTSIADNNCIALLKGIVRAVWYENRAREDANPQALVLHTEKSDQSRCLGLRDHLNGEDARTLGGLKR